jgi:hypothetical protein
MDIEQLKKMENEPRKTSNGDSGAILINQLLGNEFAFATGEELTVEFSSENKEFIAVLEESDECISE